MTVDESVAAHARRLLDAATGGDWYADTSVKDGITWGVWNGRARICIDLTEADAEFIAAAPEWVRSLLAEHDEAVKLLRVHGRCPAPGLFPEAHPRSWTKCDLCAFLARLGEQEGTNP